MVHVIFPMIKCSGLFYISIFWSMCAVPSMAVFCIAVMCFPRMFRYSLYDFEMVLVATVTAGITFVFAFYIYCISVVRYYYHHHHHNLSCRVFTLIYLTQTMFLGYTVSQPFCAYC
jgi:hypothetical protein